MDLINDLDFQIENLVQKRENLKAENFKAASVHWFSMLNAEYESSSSRTPEYLAFCKVFKRQFTKLLKDTFEISKVQISKPNHFDQTGFFELKNGNIFYFSIGDLRWSKVFLIRTAEHFKDYTGGSNQYCDTNNFDLFLDGLKRIVK